MDSGALCPLIITGNIVLDVWASDLNILLVSSLPSRIFFFLFLLLDLLQLLALVHLFNFHFFFLKGFLSLHDLFLELFGFLLILFDDGLVHGKLFLLFSNFVGIDFGVFVIFEVFLFLQGIFLLFLCLFLLLSQLFFHLLNLMLCAGDFPFLPRKFILIILDLLTLFVDISCDLGLFFLGLLLFGLQIIAFELLFLDEGFLLLFGFNALSEGC